MNGLVVEEGKIPHRRKTECCGKEARPGESVILIEKRIGGAVKGFVVLHKRCIEPMCEKLPVDATDSRRQLKDLRDRIVATGNPFPDSAQQREKRGVLIDLASRRAVS